MAKNPTAKVLTFATAGSVLRFLTKVGTIGFIIFIAYQAWDYYAPKKPEVPPIRKKVAVEVCKVIAEDLQKARGDIHKVALFHLKNDPSDFVTSELRRQVEYRGTFDLLDRTFWVKTRHLLRLRQPEYSDPKNILQIARNWDIDGAIYGIIHSFQMVGQNDAEIDLEVHLLSTKDSKSIFAKRYSRRAPSDIADIEYLGPKLAGMPRFKRFLAWLAVILLLPLFTFRFIQHAVAKHSNRANAFTLALYTLFDALWLFLLLGAAISGWFSTLLFIAGVILAFFYNVYIMKFALRLVEE